MPHVHESMLIAFNRKYYRKLSCRRKKNVRFSVLFRNVLMQKATKS